MYLFALLYQNLRNQWLENEIFIFLFPSILTKGFYCVICAKDRRESFSDVSLSFFFVPLLNSYRWISTKVCPYDWHINKMQERIALKNYVHECWFRNVFFFSFMCVCVFADALHNEWRVGQKCLKEKQNFSQNWKNIITRLEWI